MTPDERAAHAREVLTAAADQLRGCWDNAAAIVEGYRDGYFPAPPPPVTVTVRLRNGEDKTLRLCENVWHASGGGMLFDFGAALADRIAADAAVIAEKDARIAELMDEIANSNQHQADEIAALQRRIAELEQQVIDEHAAGVANARLMLDAKRKLEREIDQAEGMREEIRRRDKAELALDELLVGRAHYREDASIVENAISYIKWLGQLVDDRTHSANALVMELNAARRAPDEAGTGDGATEHAGSRAGDAGSIPAPPTSPAPIPYEDLSPPTTPAELIAWGRTMIGGDTSHMIDEAGTGLGKINEAEQVAAEERTDRSVTVDAAPAPIPLGAVVEVAGDSISPFTRCAGYWRDRSGNTWADDGGLGYMLAALYHARRERGEWRQRAEHLTATHERLFSAINWLMGCTGTFERSPSNPHAFAPYWWRSEFATRAGVSYNIEAKGYTIQEDGR